MAPYESSSSSSDSEDNGGPSTATLVSRQRQRYTPRSRAHQGYPAFTPTLSSPPETPRRLYNFGSPTPRSTRRQGQIYNSFSALAGQTQTAEAEALRYMREIRPVGSGHHFSFVPENRFQTLSPRSWREAGASDEKGEGGSEDEGESGTEEDMIAHPLQTAPRVAMEAHRGPPAFSSADDTGSAASHEGSDSESEEDAASDVGREGEDRYNQRPSVYSPPPTLRSRSTDIDPETRGYTTPPMVNFSIEDITPHSQDENSSDSDDDDCSVILPSTYSEAASSPQRPGSAFSTYNTSYPSPTPTPKHQQEEIALSIEFENLDCVGTREKEEREREVWLRKQREQKRRKRMSGGSLHKRSLSMSIGSDTDDEDILPHSHEYQNGLHGECGMSGVGAGLGVGVGGSASNLRRLRRKTLESNRHSLIFDDPPQRIVECEEPESEAEIPYSPGRRIPDLNQEDVWMGALPYHAMDVSS